MLKVASPTILHLAAVEFTATNLLRPQLEALDQAGFNPRLGCQPGPKGFDDSLLQFEPVAVAFPRHIDPPAMVRASRGLLGLLRDMQPAVVHLHTPAVAIPFRCIPRRLMPAGMKVFYTVHGFAHLWDTGTVKDFWLERTERVLARRADVMLFQSSEDLENSQLHRYKSKLRFLGNGVGEEWFAVPPIPQRHGRLRALFVGRLIKEKGIIDLLTALIQAPEVELTVVGEQLTTDRGGAAQDVSELIRHPGLIDRVRCTGRLSQDELRQEMSTTDVVVLPSYREGVPRALIEGLAAGRPLLATETRGCRELVANGKNGYLVPTGRPDQLAGALHALANLSSGEFEAMGAASKQRALGSHREQLVFERLIASYAEQGIYPAPN